MSEFILPSIGEGIETVSINELYIQLGSAVDKDTILMLVESDKASMEIPADFSGIITAIHVKSGDFIAPGTKILNYNSETSINKSTIEVENMNISNVPKKNIEQIVKKDLIEKKADSPQRSLDHATPSIKKLARELGCDISEIKGSGTNNRITKNDIYNYINHSFTSKNEEQIIDSIDKDYSEYINSFSKWGKIEISSLNNIQSTTSKRLSKSWQTIPHVTQFEDIDITELFKIIKILKKVNPNKRAKVSYIPFFIKAATQVLKELTIFNSSLIPNGEKIINKTFYNIGIAVDTKLGLMVPVIKNTDQKSIKDISIELNELILKSRNGKLSLDDMSGGCFTISSLGNIGGRFFTPIINPPEVAILGISSIQTKPVLFNKKFHPRKLLPISLSYDHRVINGSDSAKFTNLFSSIISDPSKLNR